MRKDSKMKKILSVCSCLLLLIGLAACGNGFLLKGENGRYKKVTDTMRVAMIGDYGDIKDHAFNQDTHEGCKEWSKANGADYSYYKPASDSDEDRIVMTEKAIEEGYNVIVLPGFAFKYTIQELALDYSDVIFIGLDLRESDFDEDFKLPKNACCVGYREEIGGYMAGYTAVKLGYRKLGFLGGIPVPGVVRNGYGFVQGIDAAAKEEGLTDISLNYAYGSKFYGDSDITTTMKSWYENGTQIVFPCGGAIYTSVAEAVKENDGKLIGVDTDQSDIIDEKYGKGMTVTSVIKDLKTTVKDLLDQIHEGSFAGGSFEVFGLASDQMDGNYVHLPQETTQWSKDYTKDDYAALLSKLYHGEIEVSDDIEADPESFALDIEFHDYGNLIIQESE